MGSSEREQFEAWASSQGFSVERTVGGDGYAHHPTQIRWEVWQSARRAQASAEPVGVVVHSTIRGADASWSRGRPPPLGTNLFAAPQQSPLTTRQIEELAMLDLLTRNFQGYSPTFEDAERIVRAVERAHGITATKESSDAG